MILTTDGRGEFILVAENQNFYEEFARSEEAFATVNSAQPNEPGQRNFTLSYTYDHYMGSWPAGTETRVLVRSEHVYGQGRRIRDLKIDVQDAYGPITSITPNDGMCDVRIRIRAITTEFDPATVTWNWGYTEGRLGLSETYADYLLTTGDGIVDASGLPSRRETPLAAWNGLERIHGFELRVEPVGGERTWLQVQWVAMLDQICEPVGYVILA